MPKKAIVILAPGFEEIEAITSIDILRRAGIDVTVAGLSDVKINGSRGITVIADKKLQDSDTEFDACVLPGGMPGAANLAASEQVKNIIEKMNREGKIIAAICASPALVLAPIGILKNRSATCYPGMQLNFKKETTCKEKPVVIDGNIITSRGPATALEFSLAIAEVLTNPDTTAALRKAVLATD